jgi:hypothetical protein
MATAHIQPSEPGWGARQLLVTALERLGYTVELHGAGDRWRLVLS